ncbi:hypothetical protein BB560_003608 [Smittium megazygosporum]|uniref:Uncharacterized protein n=1 Tax=Smittium megazygosporum TaxID=133381 RepID=A0A2T9ZBP1_9FUNG|nr:hypothetical protein BB560_003608 [Smittium megazygosporum]
MEELWRVLQVVPSDSKYRLYRCWESRVYENRTGLRHNRYVTEKKTKSVLKNLFYFGCEVPGRHLCDATVMNPMITSLIILSVLCNKPDYLSPILESMRDLTELGTDALVSSAASFITKNGQFLAEKGILYASNRICSFSNFLCSIITKCKVSNLSALFFSLADTIKYIPNKSNSEGCASVFELQILEYLITKIAGISLINIFRSNQIEALHGGTSLRIEAYYLLGSSNTRLQESIKKAINRLYINVCFCRTDNTYNLLGDKNHSYEDFVQIESISTPCIGQVGRNRLTLIQILVSSIVDSKLIVPLSVGLSKQTQVLENNKACSPKLSTTPTHYDTLFLKNNQFPRLYSSYLLSFYW